MFKGKKNKVDKPKVKASPRRIDVDKNLGKGGYKLVLMKKRAK